MKINDIIDYLKDKKTSDYNAKFIPITQIGSLIKGLEAYRTSYNKLVNICREKNIGNITTICQQQTKQQIKYKDWLQFYDSALKKIDKAEQIQYEPSKCSYLETLVYFYEQYWDKVNITYTKLIKQHLATKTNKFWDKVSILIDYANAIQNQKTNSVKEIQPQKKAKILQKRESEKESPCKLVIEGTSCMTQAQFNSIQMLQNLLISPMTTDKTYRKSELEFEKNNFVPRGLMSVMEQQISKMYSVLDSLMNVYYMDMSKVHISDVEGDTYADKCKYLASGISEMVKHKLDEMKKQGIELESKSNSLQNLFNSYRSFFTSQETEVNQLLEQIYQENSVAVEKKKKYVRKGLKPETVHRMFDTSIQEKKGIPQQLPVQTNKSKKLELKDKQINQEKALFQQALAFVNQQKRKYAKQIQELKREITNLTDENCKLVSQINELKNQIQSNNIKYQKQISEKQQQKLFYEGLVLKNYSYQQIKNLENKKTEQLFNKIYENYKKSSNGIVQDFTGANSIQAKKKFIAQMLKLTQGKSYDKHQKVNQISTAVQTEQEKIYQTEFKKQRQQSKGKFHQNIKISKEQQQKTNASTISQETQLSHEFIDQTKFSKNLFNQQFVITQLKQYLNKTEIVNYNLLHVSSNGDIPGEVFESPNTLILILTKSGHTFAGYTSLALNENSLLSKTMIVSTSTKMTYLSTSASSHQQSSNMKQNKSAISISTTNLILNLKYKQNDKFWTMNLVTNNKEVLKHEKQEIMDKQKKQRDNCRFINSNTLEIDVERFCVYQLILDNEQYQQVSDQNKNAKRMAKQRQTEQEKQIKDLKAKFYQCKKKEDDTNATISQSKDKLAKLTSQLKDSQQKYTSLTQQLAKSSAQYSELQKKYKTMQKQYERIDLNLSQVNTKFIQYQSKLLESNIKIIQGQQKLTILTKEITQLQSKLSKDEKKVKQQQQIQKSDVTDQKDNKLQTQIVVQQDLNKFEQQKQGEFNQKNKYQQKDLQNKQVQTITNIEQQINNLQNELKQKQSTIQKLKLKLDEKQKQYTKLLEKLQAQKEKRNQNKEIQDLNKIKADVQQLNKRKNQLEQQQLKIKKSLVNWTSRENKIRASVKQMQDRIKLLSQQEVDSKNIIPNIDQQKTQNLPISIVTTKEKQQNSEKQEQKSNTQTSQTTDELAKTTNELEVSKQQKVGSVQSLTKQQQKYTQLQIQYKKILKQREKISINLSEAKTAITEYQAKLNSQTKQISQLRQKLTNSENKIKQLQEIKKNQITNLDDKKVQHRQPNIQQANITEKQQKGKQQEKIYNGEVQIKINIDQQMNKLRDQLKQKQHIIQEMALKLLEKESLLLQMEQKMKKQSQEHKNKFEKQIIAKNKQIQQLTQSIKKLKQQTVQADQNMTRERKASVNKDKNKEKEDVTNIKADIQQLNKRKGQLQQQQLKIKKSVTDWSSREKKIKTIVEEMQARVKLLQQQEAQSKKIIQNIEQYKTQQFSLQQKIALITKQIQDLTSKSTALQSQVKINQQKSKNTKLQLKGQQSELKKLNQIKGQIQQKSKKYEQINQKIAAANIKLQQIQKKSNDQESKFEKQIKVLELNSKTARNNFQEIKKNRKELQMQIKNLQGQKLKYGGYPDRHFVGEVIQYEEDRQYILEKLRQLYDHKQVTKTKLLYSFSLMRSLNPHINVDDIPYYIILIKFKNCVSEGRNYIAALHSQQPLIQQNGSTNRGKGFISAVSKQTTFYLRTTDVHNPRLTEYNQFYFVFGNSQIRLMVGSNKFQTNIGHQYKSFNTKDHKNPEIFTGDKQQNAEMLDYEIYQVFFGN